MKANTSFLLIASLITVSFVRGSKKELFLSLRQLGHQHQKISKGFPKDVLRIHRELEDHRRRCLQAMCHWLPTNRVKQLIKDIHEAKKILDRHYQRPLMNGIHDPSMPKDLLEQVVLQLKECNIDPKGININYEDLDKYKTLPNRGVFRRRNTMILAATTHAWCKQGGQTCWQAPTIIFNNQESHNVGMITILHEIGHLLSHSEEIILVSDAWGKNDSLMRNYCAYHEKHADVAVGFHSREKAHQIEQILFEKCLYLPEEYKWAPRSPIHPSYGNSHQLAQRIRKAWGSTRVEW